MGAGVEGEVYLKSRTRILIKTVTQAIPTYTMGIFKIPKTLCDDINSTLTKYW